MKLKPYPSQEQLQALFDYDRAGLLLWKVRAANCIKVGQSAGSPNTDTGRVQVRIKGKSYYLHRLIWIWHNGDIPEDLQVDHIDQDHLNNRIENLQLLTLRENCVKRSIANKKSGLPLGVRLDKKTGKPVAQACRDGVQHQLGYFATIHEAHLAYLAFVGDD